MTGVLSARGLTVRREGHAVVDRVDADIRPGLVTAILGPNGAGKSSLLRVLAGVDAPSSGTVRLDGHDWFALPRRRRAQTAALVEQDATAELPVSVRAAVSLGRIPWTTALRGPGVDDDAIVDGALETAGVTTFADRTMSTLSGGERQRVHLARALAQQPAVLLLDEPTNHLDVRAQLATLALAERLAHGDGLAVVAALHDLNHALTFADHVVVLERGALIASGAPRDTLTPDLIWAVWGVTASLLERADGRAVITFDLPPDGGTDPEAPSERAGTASAVVRHAPEGRAHEIRTAEGRAAGRIHR